MSNLDFPVITGYVISSHPLHCGTQSCVYVGHPEGNLTEQVALKLIPRERYCNNGRYSEILSKHPGFLKIKEVRWLDEFVLVVTPFICTGDLLSHLEKKQRLTVEEIVYLLRGVLQSVKFAHSLDVALMEISVENILLKRCDVDDASKSNDKEHPQVLLSDFSRCVFVDPLHPDVPWKGLVCKRGRPPEVYRREDYDPRRLDIFQVGVVASLLCAAGRENFSRILSSLAHLSTLTPFNDPLGDLISCPPSLRRFLLRLIAVEPSERPTAEEALNLLDLVKVKGESDEFDQVQKLAEEFGDVEFSETQRILDFIGKAKEIENQISSDNFTFYMFIF
jgi:serine/threonine protein kinase